MELAAAAQDALLQIDRDAFNLPIPGEKRPTAAAREIAHEALGSIYGHTFDLPEAEDAAEAEAGGRGRDSIAS